MKQYIRGFDINRRIAIPREVLELLKINYEYDTMVITIVDGQIVLKKVDNGTTSR